MVTWFRCPECKHEWSCSWTAYVDDCPECGHTDVKADRHTRDEVRPEGTTAASVLTAEQRARAEEGIRLELLKHVAADEAEYAAPRLVGILERVLADRRRKG